jgi:hypothetical protein
MLRRVDLVKTDVSEKLGASIVRVTRIGEENRQVPVAEIHLLESFPLL